MKIVNLIILSSLLFIGCRLPDRENSDIDKIIKAKAIARTMVNYPDTLDFHDMETKVYGSTVSLTFTACNAFGVPSTHTVSIDVN